MQVNGLLKIVESGALEWPWRASTALLIISGAAGGGGGGGIVNGEPVRGKDGRGCHFGDIAGGQGVKVGQEVRDSDAITADGGDGGRGFLGETVVQELTDLSVGDRFKITIGQGGRGGAGGEGYLKGNDGSGGNDGSVLLVPVFFEEGVR